jgi:hypothetical protein
MDGHSEWHPDGRWHFRFAGRGRVAAPVAPVAPARALPDPGPDDLEGE